MALQSFFEEACIPRGSKQIVIDNTPAEGTDTEKLIILSQKH